jgi:membrane protein DedA with SNARE-associated domain
MKNLCKKILDILMKILIAFTIILWILTLFKPELIKDFIEWIKSIIHLLGYWNYLIIFITSLIESFPVLGVVVPGQNILLIVWGFFSEISRENLYYVVAIASIWAILSNYIWYFLWIYYWEMFFKKYWLWFWIWQTEVKYLKKWVKKWWAWWIIVGKFHNLTRAFVPFIAGSMKMHHKSFFIYNIIGSTVRATTIVILWVVFAEYYETVIDYFWYIMMWILALSWIYIYKFKRPQFIEYMREKNEEIENMSK